MFKGWDYTELAEKWGLYIPDTWEKLVTINGEEQYRNEYEYIQLYIDYFICGCFVYKDNKKVT